ncbi:unnamed protein product [Alopecurus aequalis]
MGGSGSKEASSTSTSDSNVQSGASRPLSYYESSPTELLAIEPGELRFHFEANKRISCTMQLTNKTDDYIAFKVMHTSSVKSFIYRPNNATKAAESEAPPHMQCIDKILVLSVVVKETTTMANITDDMFKKDSGNVVNRTRVDAVCIQQPQPPSLVEEGSQEGSSSRPSGPDEENINWQDRDSSLHCLPLQYLKDITNNFCAERILGRGGFGVVYKGVLENGEVIAVKKFVQAMSSSQEQFENEVNLLRKLEHTNIVRLVGFSYETRPLQKHHEGKFIFAWEIECLLCLEYLPKGSLDKYISGPSSGFDWPTRFKIIEGVSYGLRYLHDQSDGPVIHLDLKPGNILVDENMIPKITDFGLSRLFDQKQTVHTINTRGTLGYMPPEYLRGIITPMSDIFSLGVLIMEVITGHRDYPNDIRTSSAQFIQLELQRWISVLLKEPGYTTLETDCKQIKLCIQIGLICVNPERTRRPTMKKIIDILQGLESMDWYISNELTPLPPHAS